MIDDILNDDWSEVDDGLEELDVSILRDTNPFEFMCQHQDYQPNQKHTLFVYGSMKRGYPNHSRIAAQPGTKFLGVAETLAGGYIMGTRTSGKGITVPIVCGPSSGRSGYNIIGELYEVRGPTLLSVDLAEGVPSVYNRENVTIFQAGTIVGASMYLFKQGFDVNAKYPDVITHPGHNRSEALQEFRCKKI